jgi:hypothetical protein
LLILKQRLFKTLFLLIPMRYTLFCVLLILSFYPVYSQKDFDYNAAQEKFELLDTSLTKSDILQLYFESVANQNFDQIIASEIRIKNLTSVGEFAKAVFVADSLLAIYPVSLVALFEKSYACAALKRTEEEWIANKQYSALIRSIVFDFDGESPEKAIPIINQNDEYEIIRYLGFQAIAYREVILAGKTYDVLTLKKNKKKISELYFDISILSKLKEDKMVDELRK